MKRLTAYVSGQVQRTGYRARIMDTARALGLKEQSRILMTAE